MAERKFKQERNRLVEVVTEEQPPLPEKSKTSSTPKKKK